MSQTNNVPSATKGTADSLAAPGRVGAGGTKKPLKESAWSEFKQVAGMMLKSGVFWSLIPFNLALLMIAKWQELLTWWAKGTPFSVVEDWAEFLGFVLVYSVGNLIEGLARFFQAVFA